MSECVCTRQSKPQDNALVSEVGRAGAEQGAAHADARGCVHDGTTHSRLERLFHKLVCCHLADLGAPIVCFALLPELPATKANNAELQAA
jgi:hypothetical protein